jgi:exodeoxyribonuclease V gamma subunit
MLPMRSIPFKMICLVGMNDDAYPRQSRKLGFDLMLKHPRPGDRSRRKDDRYLFLEAVLSARKALYISYVGRSRQDNTRIPPSVVVSELLDYIEQGFTCTSGAIRERIVMEHRLQAFNPVYFRGSDRFFSYSEENYDAACSTLQTHQGPPPFVASRISSPSDEWRSLKVEQFVRFFAHPIRFLLKERLGIGLERTSMIPENSEPFLVQGLDRYQIEQMLLAKRLTGWQMQEYLPAMKASGQLPHGAVGECMYRSLSRDVEDFARLVQDTIQSGPLDPVDVNVQCGGFHLAGRITNIFQTGVVHYRYTKLKARDHLRIWIIHLLVNGFAPEGYPRQSILLGKGEAWTYGPVEFKPILELLLEIYLDGLSKPVHFFPESSFGYAQALIEKGQSEDMALQKALAIWNGSEFSRGEREDESHRLCFGKTIPLDDSFRQMALISFEPLLRTREKLNLVGFVHNRNTGIRE